MSQIKELTTGKSKVPPAEGVGEAIRLYHIAAFTDKLFGGNPAGVIPLDEWLEEDLMQKIAMENNLSETGFFVPSIVSPLAGGRDSEGAFDIRWFTPTVEINLCGHVTLASGYV